MTILCVLRLPNTQQRVCWRNGASFCFCSSIMHEVGIPSKNIAAHVWLGIPLLLLRGASGNTFTNLLIFAASFRSIFSPTTKLHFLPVWRIYIYRMILHQFCRLSSSSKYVLSHQHKCITHSHADSDENENRILKERCGVNGDKTRYFCRKLNPKCHWL